SGRLARLRGVSPHLQAADACPPAEPSCGAARRLDEARASRRALAFGAGVDAGRDRDAPDMGYVHAHRASRSSRDGALCRRAAASGPAARQLASRQRLPGLVAVAQAARNEATTPAVRAA